MGKSSYIIDLTDPAKRDAEQVSEHDVLIERFNEIHGIGRTISDMQERTRKRLNHTLSTHSDGYSEIYTKDAPMEFLNTKENGTVEIKADLSAIDFQKAVKHVLKSVGEGRRQEMKGIIAQEIQKGEDVFPQKADSKEAHSTKSKAESSHDSETHSSKEHAPAAAVVDHAITHSTERTTTASPHATHEAQATPSHHSSEHHPPMNRTWADYAAGWNGPIYNPLTWPSKTAWMLREALQSIEKIFEAAKKGTKEGAITTWKNKGKSIEDGIYGTFYFPIVGTVVGFIAGAMSKGESKASSDSQDQGHH